MLAFGTLCPIYNHGGVASSSLLMVWSWSPSGQAQLFTHHCGLFIQDIHGPVQQHNVIDSSESLAPGCPMPNPSWASRPMKELAPSHLEPTSWLLLPLPISYLIFCFSTFEPQVLYPNGGEGVAGLTVLQLKILGSALARNNGHAEPKAVSHLTQRISTY